MAIVVVVFMKHSICDMLLMDQRLSHSNSQRISGTTMWQRRRRRRLMIDGRLMLMMVMVTVLLLATLLREDERRRYGACLWGSMRRQRLEVCIEGSRNLVVSGRSSSNKKQLVTRWIGLCCCGGIRGQRRRGIGRRRWRR